MFYEQFLQAQIPKAQKESQVISVFALFGSALVKDACKMLVESSPGVIFTNILQLFCTKGFF